MFLLERYMKDDIIIKGTQSVGPKKKKTKASTKKKDDSSGEERREKNFLEPKALLMLNSF